MMYDTTKPYIQYNEQVLNKETVAGKYIFLACKRMREWFERDDMYFDYDDVDLKIRFMSKLKHSKGKFAGKYFRPLLYQQWIVANIIGWKWKETNTRVINTALLMLARKSGKTYFAAALMLAMILTDKEPGAEGYMVANSAEQARIAFEHASAQCESIDPKSKIFSRYRSAIRIPLTKSRIKVLSSDTKKQDGYEPSVFIIDEYHEAVNDELYNIMRTGQGTRDNPLGCIITTAGFHPSEDYPLYKLWKISRDMLDGNFTQDTLFSAIYQLDDEDDWHDEKVWIKANPTLGETVSYKYMREQVETATNDPSKEVSIKTKNFNMFCQSEITWIQNEKIKEVTKAFELSDFNSEEDYCIVGLDIAERSDLCVVSALIPKDDILYFKAFPFVCRTALNKSLNKDMYSRWIKQGYLTLVDADAIDIDYVIKRINEINDEVPIALVAYDPYHAQQVKIAAEKQGIPMRAVRQGLGSFGEPTTMMEQLILGKKCVIDDNPVIRWTFSNVLIKEDENANRKPVKSSHENKIDIVIAFIQTVRLYMELEGLISDIEVEAMALS